MTYRANLNFDLPVKGRPKRIIFYARGLKVYGLIPELLRIQTGGQFFSNCAGGRTGEILMPTAEPNYTAIPYNQSPEACQILLNWLYKDAGFEWAIATPEYFGDSIFSANIFNDIPQAWSPAPDSDADWKALFIQVISSQQINSDALTAG